MKIKIVYFIFLVPDRWESIVDEQLTSLKKLGLYESANEIYVSCVGELLEFNNLKIYLSKKFDKIKIKEFSEENTYEYLGFKTIYDISEDDSIILYFHTKGIISGLNNPTNHLIRKLLFKFIVENYNLHIDNLVNNNIDMSTLYPGIDGTTWYNFFWVRGEFVKNNLPYPKKETNRFYWEHWLSYSNTKKDVKTFSPILGYDKITSQDEIYHNNEKLFKLIA